MKVPDVMVGRMTRAGQRCLLPFQASFTMSEQNMSNTMADMARRLDTELLQLPTGSRLVQVHGSRPDLSV
ncbi:MAG: hypothetical protein LC637_06150, partial [Xanthomonadaceae bacterium]|nr:hypothetical protein [Xanthomonadaceae bacterium]